MSTELVKIRAPFTRKQVEALNAFQRSGLAHPFTCGNRSEDTHPWEHGDFGILRATRKGWVCDYCDYTQDWAHEFMADPDMLISLSDWHEWFEHGHGDA